MSPSPQALPAPPIHLLWIGDGAPDWPLGQVERAPDETAAEIRGAGDRLIRRIEDAGSEERDGMLLWSCHLGPPDPETVARIFRQPGELWHAGPLLGQAGRPRLLGFVHPTWMLLLDPPADRPASSWRLSPRACLLHTRHWRELGGPPSGGYRSCGAAFLEWGHRWLTRGVLCRHTPELLGSASIPGVWAGEEPLCARDELLFLHRRAGPRWTAWAAGRALLTGVLGPIELLRSWRRSRQAAGMSPAKPEPLPSFSDGALPLDLPRVTVLVPTLGRYPYLRTLLEQLSRQTVPPLEVLVIDQTEPEARQRDWLGAVPDLPVRLLERPRPGQSSARNAGLRQARGDAVLFLDDDDEIPRELIERHLRALEASGADAICGVAEEAGTGPLPSEFRRRRISDVFPTNNALVRRRALEASGLFDLAFDTGARADLDLGFRLHSSGALLLLEPSISVLHHRAPSGGLRRHRARTVTYSDSRKRLLAFHLPSVTEIYLARRYFPQELAREAELLRLAGTFALRGHPGRRLAKVLLAALLLPVHLWKLRQARQRAGDLARRFPEIPELPERTEPPPGASV